MRKNKRIILAVIVFVMLILPLSACKTYLPNEIVYVFNWGEYIDEDVNKLFTEETGIKVVYNTYDNNEAMYATLKNKSAKYDVIFPSDYMVSRLIDEDMLEPINFANVKNFEHIMPSFKNLEYDSENIYSVPYTWGTVALLYNKKFISEKPTSWKIFWDENYKGRSLMYNNSRDTLAIGLLINNFSLNTTDEAELNKACDDLITQSKFLQAYVSDQIFDIMENEDAYLAVAYSGDIISMMEENENLDFAFPVEGTNRFVDAMCIPKGSKNKLAAEKYIDFLCRADIAEMNRAETNYSTPQQQTFDALDDSIKGNLVAYPTEDILANTQVFTGLPEETLILYSELWQRIKGA